MTVKVAPRRLSSPGPVADAFMRSRAFIKICVGPVGSGKTMAALQCGLRVGAAQLPVVDPVSGVLVRKARVGVIRESYPSLRATTLKSWFNIIPEAEGDFSWQAPFTHHFKKIVRRDRSSGRVLEIIDIAYEFRAIGDQSVEEACRGWEVNAVIVDEADLQPPDLIPFLTGRVGRFSDLNASNVVDPQIIVAMNMPDIDNHAYALAFDRVFGEMTAEEAADLEKALDGRPLIETFVQPGGLDPKAENLHNLPKGRGYYQLQVQANKHKPGYVDRMVHNKPVPIMHGLPVNSGFDFTAHVRPVEWDRKNKLIIGLDQGLFAAAVASWRNNDGQFRTGLECVNLSGDRKSLLKSSPTAFGKRLRHALLTKWPFLTADDVRIVCDPAAFSSDDREDNEHDWVLAVQTALGLGKIRKAKSNRQGLRNEAIWRAQAEMHGYYVDPACRHLIKGHVGGYRYQKEKMSTGETRGHLDIAETIFTHICDAEQYAALEGEHVIDDIRGKPRRDRRAPIRNDADFDVLNPQFGG